MLVLLHIFKQQLHLRYNYILADPNKVSSIFMHINTTASRNYLSISGHCSQKTEKMKKYLKILSWASDVQHLHKRQLNGYSSPYPTRCSIVMRKSPAVRQEKPNAYI